MLYLLIDGDMVCFRACSSVERDINWGNDIWTLHVDLNEAKERFESLMDMIIEDALNAHKYTGEFMVTFCFSDDDENFRCSILPTYKANRVGKRKPVGYKALVSWVKGENDSVTRATLEADDCMGILATKPMCRDNCIIISGDKDLLSVPGYHWNFLRKEYSHISDEDAMRHFYMQTLMGDATDGYSGCPKVGKVTAQRILDKDCSWNAVKEAYEKAGLSENVAITQARVAKILTLDDLDKEGKVILWKPTEAH